MGAPFSLPGALAPAAGLARKATSPFMSRDYGKHAENMRLQCHDPFLKTLAVRHPDVWRRRGGHRPTEHCDFLSGASSGRARPPGGPCGRMVHGGPPGGRPLPGSRSMQKNEIHDAVGRIPESCGHGPFSLRGRTTAKRSTPPVAAPAACLLPCIRLPFMAAPPPSRRGAGPVALLVPCIRGIPGGATRRILGGPGFVRAESTGRFRDMPSTPHPRGRDKARPSPWRAQRERGRTVRYCPGTESSQSLGRPQMRPQSVRSPSGLPRTVTRSKPVLRKALSPMPSRFLGSTSSRRARQL